MTRSIVSKVRERGNELYIVFEIVFENEVIRVFGIGPGQPAGVSKTIVCEINNGLPKKILEKTVIYFA